MTVRAARIANLDVPRGAWIAALIAALSLGAVLTSPTRALATYSGRNGLIAFSADAGEGAQIYTVVPDGQRLHQVTHVEGDAVAPDWSPDGRTIAFELDGPDGVSVQIMNSNGTKLEALTPADECCSGDPSFTRDGGKIYFERFDPETGDDAVWRMNVDGSDPERVVSLPTGASDPNVSPDGKTLTFRSGAGLPGIDPASQNGGLFRSDIDGKNVTQLTPFIFVSIKHDWSPDGRSVLFSYNADTGNVLDSTNIATIDPDGTDVRYLTHYKGGAFSAFAGSYSPDSRWIVLRMENHVSGNYALYKMRPDGTGMTLIIDLGSLKPRLTDWGPRPEDG